MEAVTTVKTEHYKDLPQKFFKKSHELVFSQLGLSSREHDLFALFLSTLHKDHWKDFRDGNSISAPRYEFESDVLKEWFGLTPKQFYPTLRPVADRLSKKTVGLANNDDQSFDFIPLFSRIQYKDGRLMIVPNVELMSAYVDYSQGHAQIDHLVFRELKNEYAKRLYTFFSRFKDENTVLHAQSIDKLHAMMGLLDTSGNLISKSYKQNKFFLERCIRKPLHDMSACELLKNDLDILVDEETGNFGFRPVKQGKKIVALKFLFKWKNNKKQI